MPADFLRLSRLLEKNLSSLTINANAALVTSLVDSGLNEIATALDLAAIIKYRDCAILDDWDDNLLTGRTGSISSPSLVLFSGSIASLKPTGMFRPAWTETDTNATISAVGEELKFGSGTADLDRVIASSTFAVGTWSYEIRLGAANDTGGCPIFCPFYTNISNHYYIRIVNDSGNIQFGSNVADVLASLIFAAITKDTSSHTIKLTRDASGNFELFYDGVSKGTVTDNSFTTTNYTAIRVGWGALDEDNYYDDLIFY